MTFSRPGFGNVNIVPGQPQGNTPTIKIPKPATLTDNAPLRLDTSRPSVAYSNEMKRGAEVQQFLDFFTNKDSGLLQFAKSEVKRQANNEVAAAADQYGPGFLSSKDADKTPEMRDAYLSMSQTAKDITTVKRGFSAAASYPGILTAEMSDPTIRGALTKPGNDPETVEARSIAQSIAQQRALDKANFPNSYQQLQYGEELTKVNAITSSELYKERMNRAAEAQLMQTVKTGADSFNKRFLDIEQNDPYDSDGTSMGPVAIRDTWNTILQDPTIQGVEPTRAAEAIGLIAMSTIDDAEGTADKYKRLDALRKDAVTPLIVPGAGDEQINLFDVPLQRFGNKSLNEYYRDYAKKIGAEVDTDDLARAQIAARKIAAAVGPEDAYQAMIDFGERYQFRNPDTRNKFFQWTQGQTTFKDPRIQKNELRYELRRSETGLTDELFQQIQNDNLVSQEYKLRIAQNRNNPDFASSPQIKDINRALDEGNVKEFIDAGFGDPEIKDSGYISYLNKTDREIILEARRLSKKDAPGPLEERLRAEYEEAVKIRAVEIAERKAAAQEDYNPAEVVFEAVDEINRERMKERGVTAVITPKERFTNWQSGTIDQMAISINENDGKLVIDESMINPVTFRSWRDRNPEKSFDGMSENEKREVVIQGIQAFEMRNQYGAPAPYTRERAEEIFDEMYKGAEQKAKIGDNAGGAPKTQSKGFSFRTPSVFVGETERRRRYEQEKLPMDESSENVPPAMQQTIDTLRKVTPWVQDQLTVPAEQQKDPPMLQKLKEWYNNNGEDAGKTSTAIVGAFLNLIAGAPPAYADDLDNASADSLAAIRTSWQQGTRGMETTPLPQVASMTPTRYVPSAITNDDHEMFVMIGVAEGTRTAGGGYTRHYYGHRDQGDGNNNRGTVSGGRGNNLSPKQVDQKWMRILTSRSQQATPVLRAAGLEPGTAGWNRVMFNVLDLSVQSPAAVPDFLSKLGQVRRQRFTVEAIAKARADSFFSPNSGRLDAPGFGNSYQRLFKDQRARAGVFDYRRRL